MKKLFIASLVIIATLAIAHSVFAKTHHTYYKYSFPTPTITVTPTPHTHVCEGENGTYLTDNSVGCTHKCTLSDGSTYFAAEGLACVDANPSPYLGKMPKQHTHTCVLSDGTSYEADNSVSCLAE